jgi:hypothetical protein
LTPDATGLFNISVNGVPSLSYIDTNGATFSGPDNIIYFFMDDFATLATHPDTPEAGSGFIDSIEVDVPSPVPLPSTWVLFGTGLLGLSLMRWRKAA